MTGSRTKIIKFTDRTCVSKNCDKCRLCLKSFFLDEMILTKVSNKGRKKRYHVKCARLVNII